MRNVLNNITEFCVTKDSDAKFMAKQKIYDSIESKKSFYVVKNSTTVKIINGILKDCNVPLILDTFKKSTKKIRICQYIKGTLRSIHVQKL